VEKLLEVRAWRHAVDGDVGLAESATPNLAWLVAESFLLLPCIITENSIPC
jgi:hypothetical protein